MMNGLTGFFFITPTDIYKHKQAIILQRWHFYGLKVLALVAPNRTLLSIPPHPPPPFLSPSSVKYLQRALLIFTRRAIEETINTILNVYFGSSSKILWRISSMVYFWKTCAFILGFVWLPYCLDKNLKYVKKFSNINHAKLFRLQSNTRIRNNGLPIQLRPCKTTISKSIFSQRVIPQWNNLLAVVVLAQRLTSSKTALTVTLSRRESI